MFTYVKMLRRFVSDIELSMLLSECDMGYVGHTNFMLPEDLPETDEPCYACVYDVTSEDRNHPIDDVYNVPGCLEPDCLPNYRACTVDDFLSYIQNNPR